MRHSRASRRSNGGQSTNISVSRLTTFKRISPSSRPPTRVQNPQITRWVRMEFIGVTGSISFAALGQADQSAYGTSSLRYNTVRVEKVLAWGQPDPTGVAGNLLVTYNHPEGSAFNSFSVEDQTYGVSELTSCGLAVPVILQSPQQIASGFNFATFTNSTGGTVVDILCTFS